MLNSNNHFIDTLCITVMFADIIYLILSYLLRHYYDYYFYHHHYYQNYFKSHFYLSSHFKNIFFSLVADHTGVHFNDEIAKRETPVTPSHNFQNDADRDQHSTASTDECNVEEYLRIIRADRFFHVTEIILIIMMMIKIIIIIMAEKIGEDKIDNVSKHDCNAKSIYKVVIAVKHRRK